MLFKQEQVEENYHSHLSTGLSIGIVTGLIVGVAATHWYKKNRVLSADDILEQVKSEFLEDGAIEGSWIHFKKEPFQKFAIKTHVYTGGISRIEHNELAQYEFIADAHTGSIIDIYRID